MAGLGLNRLFGKVSIFFFFWRQSLRVVQNRGPKFHICVARSGYYCCKVEFFICYGSGVEFSISRSALRCSMWPPVCKPTKQPTNQKAN
jgi:hypothetical protein